MYSVEFYILLAHERQRELWRVAGLNRPIAAASQVAQGGRASNHWARGRLLKIVALFTAAVMTAAAVAQAASPLGTPGRAAGVARHPDPPPMRGVTYEPWRGWCTARVGPCRYQGEESR